MAVLTLLVAVPAFAAEARATFAGGCFWCMEPPFDALDGVSATISGYAGGEERRPSYEQVSAGQTGHLEAIQVVYDPAKVSYEKLLDVFWHNIDPLQDDGQFCDRGAQYRTAVFVQNDEERRLAQASKAALAGRFDSEVVTRILPATSFYPAEEYHQDYYKKKPVRYKYYRWGSGRDQYLDRIWGEGGKSR
jgi:methionine-S-sulfoxide reductase